MSRSWRVISLVVLIAILFGAVCVGVGLVTGGEWDRIYSTLDERYHVDMYADYVGDVYTVLKDALLAPVPSGETVSEAAPAEAAGSEPAPAEAEAAPAEEPAPEAAGEAESAP